MPSHRSKRVLLLHNAKARRGGGALEPVRARLEAGGFAMTVEPFENLPEIARDIARLHESSDAIVVCGGDGSISSAVPAVIDSGLPLGIIPAGTANDLARTLSIPLDFAAAADLVVAGHTRQIDVGMVNGHSFFNVASIGLSSELAEKLDPEIKKRFGRLGYAVAALRILATARRFRARIVEKGSGTRVKTYQIAVGNGRLYGGATWLQNTPRSMTADWISTAWKCRTYGSRCSWRGPSGPEPTGLGRKCERRDAWSSTSRHRTRCRSTPTAR